MRKMDEMELEINLKSVRITHIFTMFFLIVWVVYNWITYSTLGLPFILLLSQNIVLIVSYLFMKWSMGKDEE
jgi:hypothetical protein